MTLVVQILFLLSVFVAVTTAKKIPPTAAPTALPGGVKPKPYSFTKMSEGRTVTVIRYYSDNNCFKADIDGKEKYVCPVKTDEGDLSE